MKTYTIYDKKPEFKYGDSILVDMSCFDFPPSVEVGRVVGKGTTNLIDQWLVEFSHDFNPTYPYRVLSVPHTFIVNANAA
jgi:hypothetical protein